MASIVSARKIRKSFRLGDYDVEALKGVDLEIMPKDFLAIAGSSGSGKTTLLNLIGGIDHPTSGEILFDGIDIGKLDDRRLAKLRADRIGFIFQTFNLLPVLTALENVEYPLILSKTGPRERRKLAAAALEKVGLGRFHDHRPSQLSGGQRQRVAIARALVKNPHLILADEPTANLDAKTADEVLVLMEHLNRSDGVTFVFSSHDPMILKRAHKVCHLTDGRIVDAKEDGHAL